MDFPVGDNEAARLRALDALQILGAPADPILDRVCKLASEIFSVPIALVSLVGAEEVWFKAGTGLALERAPRALAFCKHAILSDELLVVPEASEDERFARSPLVAGEPGIRFYAGAPIALVPGLPLGTLCILDREPRTLSAADRRRLRDLADIVVGQLELHWTRLQADRRAEALVSSQERLRLGLEAARLATWEIDGASRAPVLSAEARALLGLPAASGTRPGLRRVRPTDRRLLLRAFAALLAGEDTVSLEVRLLPRAGEERWLAVTGRAFPSGEGRRIVGTVEDVTERKRDTEARARSEERLTTALRAGRAVAWERDVATDHVQRSETAEDVFGMGSGPYREFLKRVHPEDRPKLGGMEAAAEKRDTVEFRYCHPSGETRWLAADMTPKVDERGRRTILGLTFDISARKAAEEEAWRVANQDALTELPNRRLFLECLERALGEAKAEGRELSLVLFDLDDFKDINDTLGHQAGDAMLRRTADILRLHLREGEFGARLGGDEFAVAMTRPGDGRSAAGRAAALLRDLREPFRCEGAVLQTRASFGLACFPDNDQESVELLRDADFALYRAKREGGDRVEPFAPELRRSRERALALCQEARGALAEGRFVPFYQPKIRLGTGELAGFEALARWVHPTDGVLAPAAFAAAFADPEIARAITAAMLGGVTADLRAWLAEGLPCGRVALNLSTADFALGGLASRVLEALDRAAVPPSRLEVEVTETVLLGRSSDQVLAELTGLHDSGVRIALDDFGTGYASLTHLKQFPVSEVKIDRSFVAGLNQDRDDEAIVSAVIGLGRSLRMQVTAEGIETEAQAAFLRREGCDVAQGYLFGKPMPGSRVPGFLSGRRRQEGGPRPLRGAA